MRFRKAILIIHGYCGGVSDQEYLANQLELVRNFDVFFFTLPGHDFADKKASHIDYLNSAEEHLNMLKNAGYKDIYLIGHSMGGAIAGYLASRHKEVKRVVLAAPAYHYMNFKGDKLDVLPSLKTFAGIVSKYDFDNVVGRVLKTNKNSIKEFMLTIKECYDSPSNISVPTLLIRGTKDTVVPQSSVNYVYRNLNTPYKNVILIKNVNHDIYRSLRKEEIVKETIRFLKFPYTKINKEI